MSVIESLMKRGWLYQATGYTVLAAFLFVVVVLTFKEIPEKNREVYIHILGILEGAFVGNLVNHFFGSSNNKPTKEPEPPPQ